MKDTKMNHYCLFCDYWAGHNKPNEYKLRYCTKWELPTKRNDTCSKYRRDGNVIREMKERYGSEKLKPYEWRKC
jgi:hypothetical protein